MGTDYYAITIIGVSLPDEDDLPRLKTTVRKKAFKHDFSDDGDMEFHPKDGRKLWLEEKVQVEVDKPLYVFQKEDYYSPELEDGQQLIKIPRGLSTARDTNAENFYVGFVLGTGSSNGGDETVFSKLPDIGALRKQIEKLLKPIGLWEASEFGIYTVLRCSY
jgi:hypothetical protein